MADRISIEGLRAFGHHGLDNSERDAGQVFLVDVACSLDLAQAAESDSIAETIDYTELIEEVRTIVETERYLLLEALARRIIGAMLARPRVEFVSVAISKPAVAEELGLEKVEVALSGRRS
jgi:dihydroneopterin aldolase